MDELDQTILISKEELVKSLTKAFEMGWGGYLDSKDIIALELANAIFQEKSFKKDSVLSFKNPEIDYINSELLTGSSEEVYNIAADYISI